MLFSDPKLNGLFLLIKLTLLLTLVRFGDSSLVGDGRARFSADRRIILNDTSGKGVGDLIWGFIGKAGVYLNLWDELLNPLANSDVLD